MTLNNSAVTQLDPPQIEKRTYNEGDDSVRIAGVLVKDPFDSVVATYPNSTTEVYSFKLGGTSGTLVATVTVIYTDSTKASLSTVVKT